MTQRGKVELKNFDAASHDPGRGFIVRMLWFFINALIMQSRANPSSGIRRMVLRCFGAKIGRGVTIRPGVNVKFPWRLEIGDWCWIGENSWLDNLAPIRIASNCCISQGAYLCTGNHDWTDPAFHTCSKPIDLDEGVWVGAKAVIGPGVSLASHCIVTAGSVVIKNTDEYMIYSGNPAQPVKQRVIHLDKGTESTSPQ